MKRRIAVGLVILGLALIVGATIVVGTLVAKARHLGTYADMQVLCQSALKQVESGAPVEDALVVLENGEDRWGNRLLVHRQGAGDDYLFVSLGSDQSLDITRVEDYYGLTGRRSVTGQHRKDIVFKNCLPLQTAGK